MAATGYVSERLGPLFLCSTQLTTAKLPDKRSSTQSVRPVKKPLSDSLNESETLICPSVTLSMTLIHRRFACSAALSALLNAWTFSALSARPERHSEKTAKLNARRAASAEAAVISVGWPDGVSWNRRRDVKGVCLTY